MHYEIPFSFRNLLQGERLYRQPSIEESIRQHVAVLLLSGKGEWRFDPGYGCDLWDMNFESNPETKRCLGQLENSICLLLEKYEPRLHQIKVNLKPDDRICTFFDPQGSTNLFSQKRLAVQVSGILATDGRQVQLAPIELAYRPC